MSAISQVDAPVSRSSSGSVAGLTADAPEGSEYERYEGGSPGAEHEVFAGLVHDLMAVQTENAKRRGAKVPARTFHAKAALGVENAHLRILDNAPEELCLGFVRRGAEYPATVRLSNANGIPRPDGAPDLHGIAVRVSVSGEESHDLLATSFPVSHASNAREFVAFATAMAGAETTLEKAYGLYVALPWAVGPWVADRMRRNVKKATGRAVTSLATETYWSRGATSWGEAGPVRYLFRPRDPGSAGDPATGDDRLHRDLAARLATSDVEFELCVQRYVDAATTPVEDAAVEWTEAAAPPIAVARLVIPQQDVEDAEARLAASRVEEMAFNPWHTTESFRPLGNLNRIRKSAYQASAAQRLGYRFTSEESRRNALLDVPVSTAFTVLNWFVPWYQLPTDLGLLNLIFLRRTLRAHNLQDTERPEAPPRAEPVPADLDEPTRLARTYDGRFNDLSAPGMGATGATFGRNMAPVYRPDLFDTPNPVTVSDQLLARERFLPARSLNILAAAWIQFQVHDWVNHPRYPAGTHPVEVPLPDGRPWRNTPGGRLESTMRFSDNVAVAAGPGRPPLDFANLTTHWWDGSELYGGDREQALSLRDGASAELRLEDGYLPLGDGGVPRTGFAESWWLGLSLMHTLFAREHNTVCAALRAEYPHMDEDRVYATARLVVSALIAKIHTIEWTPAILATETIDIALRTNWEGPPKNWLKQLGLWLLEDHSLRGIPQSLPDHHTAPYSLTEDFVTVYRMHPLLPDDYEIVDHASGARLETLTFDDVQGGAAEPALRHMGLANAMQSFGVAHPGAITLNNYPHALRRFQRGDEMLDLAVVDLVRTRRRGVPRYNDFRAGLHKQRIRSFSELTEDRETRDRLAAVYRSVDEIDTVVGLFAENPPAGFGFSDTAFRIFILMASRRLQSDRFLTVDFRPEVYTPLGMDWVARNGMTSVLLRHCPELAARVPRGASAFAPWRPVTPGVTS